MVDKKPKHGSGDDKQRKATRAQPKGRHVRGGQTDPKLAKDLAKAFDTKDKLDADETVSPGWCEQCAAMVDMRDHHH